MKDITFCINKKCKERKSCYRAEENHPDTKSVNSYAMFDCDNEKSRESYKNKLHRRKVKQ